MHAAPDSLATNVGGRIRRIAVGLAADDSASATLDLGVDLACRLSARLRAVFYAPPGSPFAGPLAGRDLLAQDESSWFAEDALRTRLFAESVEHGIEVEWCTCVDAGRGGHASLLNGTDLVVLACARAEAHRPGLIDLVTRQVLQIGTIPTLVLPAALLASRRITAGARPEPGRRTLPSPQLP